jgi:hypothetical protein
MMKLKVRKSKVRVAFDFMLSGSVLKGTVKSTWKSVTTDLEIDSDEPMEKIVALVKNAKGGCFAENLVTQQVPLKSSITLRGETVAFSDG